MTVRTRFAPSPTGTLHLGSVRTALFCWLYARHHDGQFILRIEDTDRERSTKENVDAITDGLAWLGLDADEGPFFQTDRFERYHEVIDEWLESGKAYRCYCTRDELDTKRATQMAAGMKTRYDGYCRTREQPRDGVEPVVRFRNPLDGEVVVEDKVKQRVVFQNSELDDLIIARSDGSPTYNFSVIVDDYDMGITHVIRGDDHLNNTPRQMNMLAALGARPPVYAHLPMILGPDGAKLSKRHGAVDIRDYRSLGYLPAALLNYLVRLGWSHGDQELFSIAEMIQLFDIADVNQSASAFNPAKLLWLNQQHIINASAAQLGEALVPFLERAGLDPGVGPDPADVAEGFRERAETLVQMAESARYCYEEFEQIDPQSVKKSLRPIILEPMKELRKRLADLPEWSTDEIARTIEEVAVGFEISMGKLGQPLRVAVTGGSVSPPIDVTVHLVGRERCLNRIDRAIELIELRAAEGGHHGGS
ncbi:MAG TPA: glutamate--tRNA ligase [Woeseiaceae bacterium]|nr:glutamate--tRNA ligase [Woeseiaceae bacterium]